MAYENSPQEIRKKPIVARIEWGNAPQWVSAVCAFLLAALAIWGIFFSATSQALVAYLQSELAVRNQRIAALELRERELQFSITAAQSSLGGLAGQKDDLEKQISALKIEQQGLSDKVKELGLSLSTTEFLLVREKISAQVSSVISEMMVIRLNFIRDIYEPQGVRARLLRPMDSYVRDIREIAEKLPDRDRTLARLVVSNFEQQCARYKNTAIQIPALRIPREEDFSKYNYDRSKHPTNIRLELIGKQIEKAEEEIEACFKAVKP